MGILPKLRMTNNITAVISTYSRVQY